MIYVFHVEQLFGDTKQKFEFLDLLYDLEDGGDVNIIDVIVETASKYSKHDPEQNKDESDYLIECIALLNEAIINRFVLTEEQLELVSRYFVNTHKKLSSSGLLNEGGTVQYLGVHINIAYFQKVNNSEEITINPDLFLPNLHRFYDGVKDDQFIIHPSE